MIRSRSLPALCASALLIVAMPVTSASVARAVESVFEPYTGSFRGQGTLRRKPGEPRETVRCRINAKLSSDGLSLKQTGICVVPGSKVPIDSNLKYNSQSGRVTGTWTDVANGSAAAVSGRIAGDRISLTIAGKDTQTGETRTLWMTLQPASNGYGLTTRSPNENSGGKFVSGEIRFRK